MARCSTDYREFGERMAGVQPYVVANVVNIIELLTDEYPTFSMRHQFQKRGHRFARGGSQNH